MASKKIFPLSLVSLMMLMPPSHAANPPIADLSARAAQGDITQFGGARRMTQD